VNSQGQCLTPLWRHRGCLKCEWLHVTHMLLPSNLILPLLCLERKHSDKKQRPLIFISLNSCCAQGADELAVWQKEGRTGQWPQWLWLEISGQQ
jgi:hypothetical protein